MGPDSPIPSALRARARWARLGPDVPAMIVTPPSESGPRPVPVVLWMHGRTVHKELDPGRYLRWLRAGIGACAVDLPGHGERYDARLQDRQHSFEVLTTMVDEIDPLLEALATTGEFDLDRVAIGGVSAGGMVTLSRLTRPHRFRCAAVEATSGSWAHRRGRPIFQGERWVAANPIEHLDGWREIPLQVIHARYDEWMPIEAQTEFVAALCARYRDPEAVELIEYERTGAAHEHVGFGRMAADAKNRQLAFFKRWLLSERLTGPQKPLRGQVDPPPLA